MMLIKIKKILLVIPILVSVFLFNSCGKDFTSLSPQSQRSSDNYYKSKTDFNTALMGVYSSLQLNGTYRQAYILELGQRSDNLISGGGQSGLAEVFSRLDKFDMLPTANLLEETWSDSYKGIDRANNILARIDNADFDEALKDQYKGEALFIRSLLYYNLAVIFGNIPLKLKPTNSIKRNLSQVDASKIYGQISGDLDEAAQLLPENYSADNTGRATSWAAKALEGKVLLTSGNKTKAKTVLKDIVENGPYHLLSNFADIFGPNNKNNAESIFEVQFKSGGIGEGSMYTDMFFHPGGDNIGVGGGNIPEEITESIRDAFESGDKRFPVSVLDTSASQGNWAVPKYDGTTSGPLDDDVNWIVLRYADVLLMYAEALGEPEGYTYINKVRTRAGLGSISSSSTETYDEQLLHERRVELAFEGQRWPDLLRFGEAKKVMAKQLTQQFGNQYTEDQIHLLYPIPQQEIDNSEGSLKQNPGY
jgi:hypothetical protein